jgi:hypothetical protein
MNKSRCLELTAVVCLFLAAAVSQAAIPAGSALQTHLKYAGRA